MKETLRQKFERLFQDIYINIDPHASTWKKLKITADFLWEKYRYDIELIDYIQYRFYYKKREERDSFITHGKLVKIIKICNDPNSRKFFDQKPLFNEHFQEYIGRKWLDVTKCSKNTVKKFLNEQGKIFTKCPDGMFGKGIQVIESKSVQNFDSFYEKALKQKLLLEEVLTQHKELAEFNESSVNSFRIVTLVCANGSVKVMAGVLRLGRKGKFADNFHHHGIASLVDVQTGIVCTVGVDRNWNRFVVHPDSGKPIVGLKVPQWDNIVDTVKKAAIVHPEVRYVGWDVTIKEDGTIVLIEGNPGADPDVTQIEDQIGKWPLYKPLLGHIKNQQK